MTPFLCDSGIASDYLNRRHGVYERAREEVAKGNPVGIGVPVLAELASGIERSQTRDRNLQRLKAALFLGETQNVLAPPAYSIPFRSRRRPRRRSSRFLIESFEDSPHGRETMQSQRLQGRS
jgi:predicted nucleic acid-binding protein